MMADELCHVTLDAGEVPIPNWASGQRFTIPASIVAKLEAGSGVVTAGDARDLRLRRAFTLQRPTSSRLPIPYHAFPPRLRTLVALLIGRRQRRRVEQWADFPGWPLDLSADLLSDLAGELSPFANGPTPVILTHDLDSAEGLYNLCDRFLSLEEAAGARSVNFIVPHAWKIDIGFVDELTSRGHELGIHGYDHSNKTPFVDRKSRHERLSASAALIERYRIRGYRAPSLVRTPDLLADLELLYGYDSSIPTSGGLFPVPNNGCASARPFLVGRIAELPLSMPRDGSLKFLGHTPKQILALWIECADRIAASGGVIVLLTHCEDRFSGNDEMLVIYRELLDYFASSDRFVWSMPEQILAHLNPQIGAA